MKRQAVLLCGLLLAGMGEELSTAQNSSAIVGAPGARGPALGTRRLVYAHRSLQKDQDVTELLEIAKQAAQAGMNGIVLSAGFSRIEQEGPAYFERLEKVRKGFEGFGIELIPIFMTVGYGDGLERNPNLAAGLPVRDSLFVAQHGKAVLQPDPSTGLRNGGFEETDAGSPFGYKLGGTLGGTLVLDTDVRKTGERSLRIECAAKSADDPGYIFQTVKVNPYRCYVLRGWIRTEGLDRAPDFALGHIRFEVKALPDGRRLQYHDPGIPTQTDWTRFAVGFNSWGYQEVEVSIGNQTSKSGQFWLDDLELTEVGPINVLRRPGTPVAVRGESNGLVYQEGSDFQRIEDPRLDHRFDHDIPEVLLTSKTRIREGEKLRVSWYHSAAVYQSQVSVCMSEPELYEIWREQVRAVNEHLQPKTYLLSMDEVRAGGTCEACEKRGISMGRILGDCITRQVEMIREVSPEAEIAIWSDMLDPHHNARKDPYYLVKGDFDGSWDHIPKDLVMAIWGREVRPESFKHFSNAGFRTLGAAYYDTDDLKDITGWLRVMRGSPGVVGIMYTTWLDKYRLLPDFGRMVARGR